MISHLHVDAYEQNSRISFVLNTVCDWYGWSWGYGISTEASSLHLAYGTSNESQSLLRLDRPFPLHKIGSTHTESSWGSYHGVPNPCLNDPIAGIFYLLTCAEEYTSIARDEHGRVPAQELSVVKNGYGSIPLADRLAEVLAKAIWNASGQEGSPIMKKEKAYSSLDIDQVYAVRYKPAYKKIFNLGRSIYSGKFLAIQEVLGAVFGGKDPFDQFDWIKNLHEERGIRPFVFLLMGYENATDPAWNPGHPQWPTLFQQLSSWAQLGLHPSYRTTQDEALLRAEKLRFEALLGESTTRSRQHYLRVAWPTTFQSLVNAGITEDFTLAWPDWLGFRMGTARSCYWYDLEKDEQTALRLYPPSMMEVTGRYYLGLSSKQFLAKAKELASAAERSNSGLRLLWHNTSLSEFGGWGAWKGIYPKLLDLIAG